MLSVTGLGKRSLTTDPDLESSVPQKTSEQIPCAATAFEEHFQRTGPQDRGKLYPTTKEAVNNPKIKHVTLEKIEDNEVDPLSCLIAANLLDSHSDIESVNINKSYVYDNDVTMLEPSIKDNKSLKTFKLTECGFYSENTKKLFSAIGNHPNLKEFDCSGSDFLSPELRAQCMDQLMETQSIQNLNLSKTGISLKSIEVIVGKLKDNNSITELNLSDNTIIQKGKPELVEALETVFFTNISLTLASNKSLKALNLFNTGLSDDGKDRIRQITQPLGIALTL